MKLRHFLFFIHVLLITQQSFAQRHCATQIIHQQKKLVNPELYKEQENYKIEINQLIQQKKALRTSGLNDVYSIPVVVHVVYNGISSTNISDAQVLSQINVLNEDFRKVIGTNGYNTNPIGADVKIEFCLASADPNGNFTTGIVRKFNAKSEWNAESFSEEIQLKALSYWPSDRYLNIWVCRLSSGYLGYAQYPVGSSVSGPSGSDPEIDGVVIDYRAFGNTGTAGTGGLSLYDLGRTTTHEVGHWLGLLHIWGENDFSGCSSDYVADTPKDSGPNDDADCIDSSDCDGIFTLDMTANYLDYSPDNCMNLFTIGQKDRMRAVMESAPRRMALLASTACCVPTTPAAGPLAEDFESGTVPPSWTVYNPDGGSPEWNVSSPGAYDKSSFSIRMENDLAMVGDVDSIESTYIKFNNIKPVLEFDLAYAGNSTADTDSLVISYGLGCSHWAPLVKLSGSTLITTTRTTDNFIPLSGEWKRIRVDLNPLDNLTGRIRFENYSKSINTIYIDNINIYKTPENLSVHPYPNPAREALKVEVQFPDIEDVHYELYDLLGQKVFEETDHQKSNYTKIIDISSISRGMYILKVSTRFQKETKKIILY